MDEVIARFNAAGIRYLLIGGQAVRLAGIPRFSMDWDVYVPGRDAANLAKINEVLADELDVPLEFVGPRGEGFVQTYQTRWGVIQFHLAGASLPPFDEAEARAVSRLTEEGVPVKCLSRDDLIASKRRAGRPQDLDDARYLEQLREE